jgi:argininosuccinate lyase
MASESTVDRHKFIEGVGGRLGASKTESYARAVLNIEGRGNQYAARHMLASDLSYVLTAMEMGITPEKDGKALIACLLDLIPKADQLGLRDPVCDILVRREFWVADIVGQETGSWLHVGRNRAESLRGLIPRMFFREALAREHAALIRLVRALVDKAEPVLDHVIPFYQHLNHAGRSTLGEYLLSWATKFEKHFDRLDTADRHLDEAPPPNCGRPVVIELINKVGHRLGFSEVGKLWSEAFITEEQFSEPFFTLVQLTVCLARLAEDLRLWTSYEFGFFELADEHASGSSGRPQKKNPFALQSVISGASIGAGRLAAQLATNVTVSEEQDSTYHMYSLYEYANDVVSWTDFMADAITKGEFKLAELNKKSSAGYAGAREALDVLVYEHAVPYRFAHHVLGGLVRAATDGADEAGLVKVLSGRLKDYPAIDCEGLVKTVLATSTEHIMLNLNAFREVHQRLDQNVRARENKPVPDPVGNAIERLMQEGREAIARSGVRS